MLVVEPLFTPKVRVCASSCARGRPDVTPGATNPQADRERLVQLLFEQFNVAGVYVADAAVLSLYAVGKLSGLAVDVGAGKVGASPPLCCLRNAFDACLSPAPDICPVFEGTAMTHAARRLAFGGDDVDEHLVEMLRFRCAHRCMDSGNAAV